MKIAAAAPARIDWSEIPATLQAGATGTATARTFQVGDVRLRMVEYSPGYVGDHWCTKGHLVLVLAGRMTLQLEGADPLVLVQGDSLFVADEDRPHRPTSDKGARLFVVD